MRKRDLYQNHDTKTSLSRVSWWFPGRSYGDVRAKDRKEKPTDNTSVRRSSLRCLLTVQEEQRDDNDDWGLSSCWCTVYGGGWTWRLPHLCTLPCRVSWDSAVCLCVLLSILKAWGSHPLMCFEFSSEGKSWSSFISGFWAVVVRFL